MEGPKITRVRKSKRVKKRSSLRSSAAFSNRTRLSIVTEDDEERSVKSDKSNESKDIQGNNSEFDNEKQVYSNV